LIVRRDARIADEAFRRERWIIGIWICRHLPNLAHRLYKKRMPEKLAECKRVWRIAQRPSRANIYPRMSDETVWGLKPASAGSDGGNAGGT
jgi:hypothetical protein